ncbi:MAG: hypothetical protein AAGA75_09095 [Cyanobacteria bacterium P01_E01_bin.6]
MVTHTPNSDLLWRGTVYLSGQPANLPDDLAIALGINPSPKLPLAEPVVFDGLPDERLLHEHEEVLPEDDTLVINPTLSMFNSVQDFSELTPIPTVGKVSAQAIIDNRPDEGYESLEQVAELNPDLRCDWKQVEAWRGEE